MIYVVYFRITLITMFRLLFYYCNHRFDSGCMIKIIFIDVRQSLRAESFKKMSEFSNCDISLFYMQRAFTVNDELKAMHANLSSSNLR